MPQAIHLHLDVFILITLIVSVVYFIGLTDSVANFYHHNVAIFGNFYYFCSMNPRSIKYFKSYFSDFYKELDKGTQTKVAYVLRYIQQAEQWSQKFVKHLGDGLFEARIEWQSNIYRVFFVLDDGNIVVLFNGFHKKTQKTPHNELEKAKRIKKEYYESK